MTTLGSPVDDPFRNRHEPPVVERRAAQCLARPLEALRRQRARSIETEQRRIGRLGAGGVLAGGLAELGRAALDVEDVIDNLEGEADIGGESVDGAAPYLDRLSPALTRLMPDPPLSGDEPVAAHFASSAEPEDP